MSKARWKNFTKEEITQFTKESISFRQLQQKLGYSATNGSVHKTLEEVLNNYQIDYSHFKGHAWNKEMSKYEDALTDFGTHTWSTVKEKLFKEREYRCECCGISDWNGKELILQVHHIDGNHNNNTRENLMILCPNCHSQTNNWLFRKNRSKITDEQFLEVLQKTDTICQACRILGISPNQNNYKRARKLLENSEL